MYGFLKLRKILIINNSIKIMKIAPNICARYLNSLTMTNLQVKTTVRQCIKDFDHKHFGEELSFIGGKKYKMWL